MESRGHGLHACCSRAGNDLSPAGYLFSLPRYVKTQAGDRFSPESIDWDLQTETKANTHFFYMFVKYTELREKYFDAS